MFGVTTDLQNVEKSGNLKETSEVKELVTEFQKSRNFFCLKFIFSQVEDPNFENFLGTMPPDPPNDLGLTVELSLGLEKSGNFTWSGKRQP